MKNKKIFLNTLTVLVIASILISCKKPRNGEYNYEENGTKTTYLSESGGPYNLAKQGDYTNSSKVKIKTKSSTIYIEDVAWDKNGDSATYRSSTNTSTSSNSSFKSAYSYRGLITGKKSIEGVFNIVQVTHSFSNITIDSIKGTFKYSK